MLSVVRGRRLFGSLIKAHGVHGQPTVVNLPFTHRLNSSAVDLNTAHAGKVAVMTASTDGIGLAIARRLAQQGAHVVLSSRRQENVDKAVKQLKSENLSVSGTICNVTNEDHRKSLVELTFHTNVTTTFLLVKQVLPHMQKLGGGSIVLTSSAVAYSFFPNLGPYNVSKTALTGLTKILASELYPMNIRLNSLAPGLTRTSFSTAVWTNEAFLKDLIKVHGFLRLAEPEEFAGIVSFLFSSDASYLTGETVVVGGGFKTRL
ncbi:dehydrogenase/reductase SDR family member 4-like isoform X2 [Lissotriton helveticus]